MKKRIDNYLPKAVALISEVKIANPNAVVDRKFKGYFSSFGALIGNWSAPFLYNFESHYKYSISFQKQILLAVYFLLEPFWKSIHQYQ